MKPALQIDPGSIEPVGLAEQLAQRYRRLNLSFETVSALLRILGAAVVISALSILLFNDWAEHDDITRCLSLLGFTAMMAISGLLCGGWIKESKGARMILSLVLLAVPIHFVIQGGLLLSQFVPQGIPLDSDSYWLWTAPDLASVLWLSVGSGLVLSGLSWLSMRVLAPRSVAPLTGLFLLNSALLLLPWRASFAVALLAVAMLSMIWVVLRGAVQRDAALKTAEGVYVRLVQILPLCLLLGREWVVYGLEDWMFLVLSGTMYVGLRSLSLVLARDSDWPKRINAISVVPAIWLAASVTNLLANYHSLNQMLMPVFSIVFAALMYELSTRIESQQQAYHRLGLIALAFFASFTLMIQANLGAGMYAFLIGLLVVGLGYYWQRTGCAWLGGLTLIHGLGFQIHYAIDHLNLGGWGSLAAVGILCILTGSIIERYGLQWKTQLQLWQQERGVRD